MELAELVVEAEIFPAALSSLRDSDEYVQKNVATLIREVSKHTPEVTDILTNSVLQLAHVTNPVQNLPVILTPTCSEL